jgi:hypothetical protein
MRAEPDMSTEKSSTWSVRTPGSQLISPMLVNRAPPMAFARDMVSITSALVIKRGNAGAHPTPFKKRVRYGAIWQGG